MSVLNPFIVKNILHIIDSNDEKVIVTKDNFYRYTRNIYILCPLSDKNIVTNSSQLLNQMIENYDDVISNFVIYSIDYKKIIKNAVLFEQIVIVNKLFLEKCNIFNYELNEFEFVVPILNVSFLNIKDYLEIVERDCSFVNIYKIFQINKELQTNLTIDNLQLLINGNTDYKKWYYYKDINRNKFFVKRNFTKRKKIDNITIEESFVNDYLQSLKDYDKEMTESIYIKYNVPQKSELNDKIIYDIIEYVKSFDKDISIKFLNKIYTSPQYCHHLINSTLFNNDHILFTYGWALMLLEEIIIKEKTLNNRFIFNIDTLQTLSNNLLQYLPTFGINKKVLKKNVKGISEIEFNDKYYRLCNKDEFVHRLKLFTSHDHTKYIFEHFDFKQNNMVICGSSMPACIHYSHPLTCLFENQNNPYGSDSLLLRYFEEYYSESDIDIMTIADNHIDYLTKVDNLYNQLIINLLTYYNSDSVQKTTEKNIYVSINRKYFMEKMGDDFDGDYSKDKIFIKFYNEIKQLHQKVINENTKDYDINQLKNDYPFYFLLEQKYINIYISERFEENISIKIGLKTKISSTLFPHNLEIFTTDKNFITAVSRFHLPCVRAYYDGDTVYMTPSFITAHKTFMNIDYKYFSGKSSYVDIINKYRMRGFGTILNKKELKQYVYETVNDPFYSKLLPDMSNGLLLTQTINSKLYRPRFYCFDYFHKELPQEIKSELLDQINNYNQLQLYSRTLYNYSYEKNDGTININFILNVN